MWQTALCYGALHYILKLRDNYSGARYDELKGLVCELQVRTILQDAWAVVAHHLSYKHESDVPRKLRRKLNTLSAIFENADEHFDDLRREQLEYSKSVQKEISAKDAKITRPLNLESFMEYLKWKFPAREQPSRTEAAAKLEGLVEVGFTRIDYIDYVVSWGYEALRAYELKYPPFDELTGEKGPYTATGALSVIIQRFYLEVAFGLKFNMNEERGEFRHLLGDLPSELKNLK